MLYGLFRLGRRIHVKILNQLFHVEHLFGYSTINFRGSILKKCNNLSIAASHYKIQRADDCIYIWNFYSYQ
ncbi:MAG: hypothetical protein LBI95_03155 [Holosporales bacterium]|nr:hypothetical protein [Holosporales bacterium]